MSSCVNALTYTNGYDAKSGWMKWAGYHSGTWWSSYNSQSFNDGARWDQPYLKYDLGQTYAVQKVTFDSQWRKDHCTHVDQTGSTCRYGWNQSGVGVRQLIQRIYRYIAFNCFMAVSFRSNMCGDGILRTTNAPGEAPGAALELMLALHLIKGQRLVSYGSPMMKHSLNV